MKPLRYWRVRFVAALMSEVSTSDQCGVSISLALQPVAPLMGVAHWHSVLLIIAPVQPCMVNMVSRSKLIKVGIVKGLGFGRKNVVHIQALGSRWDRDLPWDGPALNLPTPFTNLETTPYLAHENFGYVAVLPCGLLVATVEHPLHI